MVVFSIFNRLLKYYIFGLVFGQFYRILLFLVVFFIQFLSYFIVLFGCSFSKVFFSHFDLAMIKFYFLVMFMSVFMVVFIELCHSSFWEENNLINFLFSYFFPY